jgi:hypothetical protein
MSDKLQDNWYARVVRDYACTAAVPQFNLDAIERRSGHNTERRPYWERTVLVAAVAVALLLLSAPALPALIAHAIHAFVERDGQLSPATNREVSLEEAARLAPFRVIRPSGVPLASTPMIQLITVVGDPQGTQLFIEYAASAGLTKGFTALPRFTIIETAASSEPANLRLATDSKPLRPNASPGPGVLMRIHLLAITWVEDGTRVTVSAAPGSMTMSQLKAIRRAMGGS